MPASGEAVLNIDRRKISVETKRALEGIPGLSSGKDSSPICVSSAAVAAPSQGCLKAASRSDGGPRTHAGQRLTRRARVRDVPERRVQVETIFGEVFEADAVGRGRRSEPRRPRSTPAPMLRTGAGMGSRRRKDCALPSRRLGAEFREDGPWKWGRALRAKREGAGLAAGPGWSTAPGRVDDGAGGDDRAPSPPSSEAQSS